MTLTEKIDRIIEAARRAYANGVQPCKSQIMSRDRAYACMMGAALLGKCPDVVSNCEDTLYTKFAETFDMSKQEWVSLYHGFDNIAFHDDDIYEIYEAAAAFRKEVFNEPV